MELRVLTIVLLSWLPYQFAFADITLNYTLLLNNSKQQLTYQIKNHQLMLSDSGSDRVNLFDQQKQQFISHDPESKKVSILNKEILEKRITQLKQKHKKQVTEVEQKLQQKLKDMSTKEQEVGASILNQIKYPDLYGEHTLLEVSKTSQSKTISKMECTVYQLSRKGELLKDYCVADRQKLSMSKDEYQTLRSFYHFDYTTQSSLMLAMGKSNFELVDYDEKNIPGIILEIISYKDKQIKQHLLLNDYHNKSLADDIFVISSSREE